MISSTSPSEAPQDSAPRWNLLIIADEGRFLQDLLQLLPPDEVRCVAIQDPKEALRHLGEEVFHLLLLSCAHIGTDERRLLETAMDIDDSLPIFLLVERWEQVEHIKQVVRPMTWTVLVRPLPMEHVRLLLQAALDRIRLLREVHYLRHREPYIYRFDNIVGESAQIQELLRLVERVAPSDATILIQGESGTGKELIAAAVHFNSPRRDAPFVAVNCATLQENLLESELFGHEKGAYTGADRQRIGRFEQANGGTLFLDEVGDMSAAVQAKVLRVLQEKTFERLGGSKAIRVNVRVVAATNQELRKAISEKRFREDLYYRLSVVPLYLAPLRDRPEDIEPLAGFFLRKYWGRDHLSPKRFSPEAINCLKAYHWPGNIRELENVVERAILVSQGEWITPEDLMLPVRGRGQFLSSSVQLPPGGVKLEEVERDLVYQALERAHGVQKKAAQMLGISPRTMHYKIRKHGIKFPLHRG